MTDTHEKREKIVAGALLVAERDGQRSLTETVKRSTVRLASRILSAPDDDHHDELADEMVALQDDSKDDILEIRAQARASSREAHRRALNSVLTGASKSADAKTARKRVDDTIARLAREKAAADAVSARLAAQIVSAAWSSAAARVLAGDVDKAEKALRLTRTLPGDVAGTLRRVAVTEAASAHNDEVRRLHESLPQDVRDTVQLRWSAFLDGRTCDRCANKNGNVIVSTYPPEHPRCRCICTWSLRAKTGRAAA